jgi:hypothetical protein
MKPVSAAGDVNLFRQARRSDRMIQAIDPTLAVRRERLKLQIIWSTHHRADPVQAPLQLEGLCIADKIRKDHAFGIHDALPTESDCRTCKSDAQSSLVSSQLFPVLLDARRTQTCEAVLVNAGLPREIFLDRKHITIAGFLKREQATTNCGNHFRFASDDPARCTRRW